MNVDLSAFSADRAPGNPARVAAVADLAARLDDSVPAVLLPVRLETRFVTVEVPIVGPGPTLLGLRDLLIRATRALTAIARTDLRTSPRDRGDLTRAQFRARVEGPMYTRVDGWLDEAWTALDEARVLQRDVADEGRGGEVAVLKAAAMLTDALDGAEKALRSLRSPFQREGLGRRITEIRALAEGVVNLLRGETLPAIALRTALAAPGGDEREGRGPVRRAGPLAGTAPRVVLGDAVPADASPIPGRRLAEGAAVHAALLDEMASAGGDADEIRRLAGSASTIPLLPAAYKRGLLDAADELASRTHAPVDDLIATIRRIPSDDRSLDDAVARPELTLAVRGATRTQDRLLVRIYPDDIVVDTHEEDLTGAEHDAGVAFWTQTLASDDAGRRAAWRALCLGRSSQRAAWIAREMKPRDPEPTPGALAAPAVIAAMDAFEAAVRAVDEVRRGGTLPMLAEAVDGLRAALSAADRYPDATLTRLRERFALTRDAAERLLGRRPLPTLTGPAATAAKRIARILPVIARRLAALEPDPPPEPVFPDAPADPKASAWTRAPGSWVLPERFLVLLVADGGVVHAVAGAAVDPELKLGVDPDPAAGDGFSLDERGELTVGRSIRWMVDFAEAESKGMAIAIDITPQEAVSGFERVYAIGLRGGDAGGTGSDGATRLEAMLDAHHYGGRGVSLVTPGTPTNNTEAAPAGLDSTDDPDASYDRERGAPAYEGDAEVEEGSPDGLRLSRALGVRGDRLTHVAGAGGHSVADALTAGRVLYAATIGGWLEEMATPLVPLAARDRMRRFTLQHVTGRGLVPAFRVGDQPYGVLPVTAWSAFVPDPAESDDDDQAAQATFDGLLKRVLDTMIADWRAACRDRIRIATDPPDDDARAHFLRVLGLEPVARGGGYRFAVNVAGRHGPPSLTDDLRFGLPPVAGGGATGARFGPFALLEHFEQILRDAAGITGTAPLRDPETGLVHPDLEGLYDRIREARVYEVRLLERVHRLRGTFAGADPATALGALLDADPAQLASATTAGTSPSLLALLVRHAHLMELRDAAMRLLVAEGALTPEDRDAIGASGQFLTGVTAEALTPWSYLLRDLDELNGVQRTWPTGHPLLTGRLIDRLKPSAPQPAAPYSDPVAAHAEDIERLAAVPAAELGRLLGEHLDLAGNRLDAWVTGFAQRRLAAMRVRTPRGAHVGAYGWVESLKPDDLSRTLATNVPPILDDDPSRPVHRDPESQGFVHTPSVNHAVTAAILRSGYISQHGQADVENRMAVNLSSRRTRLALGLIDGVRAGNRLGALLGYRLERFLHEFYAGGGPTLDALIGPLRAAYPSIAGVDAALSEDVAGRAVCDGLAILEAVQRWIDDEAPPGPVGATVQDVLRANPGERPWGLADTAVPPAGDAKLDGFISAIDHIADALDAVADLVVAEGVHQLALGNHPRAAAVLTALAEGKAPPRPEVVDTPRTGTPVSHRVVLPLPSGGPPPAWAAIPLTPRAAAEPALNAWLAGLLGDPSDIRVWVTGALDDADADEVGVAEMELHAIDLVAILGPGLETGWGEIGARALDALRPPDLDDAAPPPALRISRGRRPRWDAGVRSVFELAPLLEALSELIGRSRPATSHDYAPSTPGATGGEVGVDAAELAARVAAAQASLDAAGVELARLIASDPTLDESVLDGDAAVFLKAHAAADLPPWAQREAWRSALVAAADFGMPAALPPTGYTARVPVRQELRAAAETAFAEVVDRRRRAADAISRGDAEGAARAQFGEAFTLVPQVAIANLADLSAALSAPPATSAELEGWLQGVASVREGSSALADALVLADAVDATLPELTVAQLPHDPDEPWLGGRISATDVAAPGRLSIVLAGSLDAGGAALLVDEWSEAIPATHETTGVAVHYDQPDSSPPQAVLIAVPPEVRGRWRLGELVQAVHDTFELARIRAVELEHLAPTIYGQILPAISGELVPEAAQGATVAGDRVVLDFGSVR